MNVCSLPVCTRRCRRAASRVEQGAVNAAEIERDAAALIPADERLRLEYLQLVDPDLFQPVTTVAGPVVAAGALWVGQTRLIDNVRCTPRNQVMTTGSRLDGGHRRPAGNRRRGRVSRTAGTCRVEHDKQRSHRRRGTEGRPPHAQRAADWMHGRRRGRRRRDRWCRTARRSARHARCRPARPGEQCRARQRDLSRRRKRLWARRWRWRLALPGGEEGRLQDRRHRCSDRRRERC